MSEFLLRNLIAEVLFGKRLCESYEDFYFVNVVYETIEGHSLLEKLLVGEPVSVPELRKLLHNKILNFEFIKLDGEIRPARGTTMMKYIPQSDHPKGIRPSSPKVATFYDLDKKAWRSVSNKSKEVVMKYGFGEKKKPVFVVKDRDQDISIPKEEPVEEPIDVGDEISADDIEDVTPVSKPEVEIVSKPDVDIVPAEPKYGWRPKQKDEPEEDLPSPGEIEDIIVKPTVGWKPKAYKKEKPIQVILPKLIGGTLPAEEPMDLSSPGPKPPPLSIEPEEE